MALLLLLQCLKYLMKTLVLHIYPKEQQTTEFALYGIMERLGLKMLCCTLFSDSANKF